MHSDFISRNEEFNLETMITQVVEEEGKIHLPEALECSKNIPNVNSISPNDRTMYHSNY